MADPTALEPTEIRIALLRDIAAGRVQDDTDHMPMLTVDGEPVPVGTAVWEMERHDWVGQDCGQQRWEPKPYGRQLLAEADR
ncbi:hypothetical protein OHA21_43730 [Actinoplanes sp. NBC_00393]|uniref:hypothetical protein n=1 Tax=Actinoplanes sp. NBC_00393 TaxID=2975953 RepID=UPI002E1C10C7